MRLFICNPRSCSYKRERLGCMIPYQCVTLPETLHSELTQTFLYAFHWLFILNLNEKTKQKWCKCVQIETHVIKGCNLFGRADWLGFLFLSNPKKVSKVKHLPVIIEAITVEKLTQKYAALYSNDNHFTPRPTGRGEKERWRWPEAIGLTF